MTAVRPARLSGWPFLLLGMGVLLIAGAALFSGYSRISPDDLFGSRASLPETEPIRRAFWTLRLPRVVLGMVAGAGLAVAGVILQGLFRNPLAEPYTIGVAGGASLGAALGIALGMNRSIPFFGISIPSLSAASIAGAIVAMAMVMFLARMRRDHDITRLLLAGVCVAYACAAGILAIQYFMGRAVTNDIVNWLIGSLDGAGAQRWTSVAVMLVLTLGFGLAMHRGLDLLAMGDDLAASRGVAVSALVWTSFVLVALLTAVIVTACGPIAFVGLMMPNITRAIFGGRTLPLLAGSALLGAGFLTAADAVARLVLVVTTGGTQELPVGIITQIVGAIFFFVLLLRERSIYAVAPR